jgi:hypothetical protein
MKMAVLRDRLLMVAVRTSETSDNFYHSTPRNNADRHLHSKVSEIQMTLN